MSSKLQRIVIVFLALMTLVLAQLAGLPAAGQGAPPSGEVLPQNLPPLTGIAQVAAGGGHTCALKTNGGVLCWGIDALGDGTSTNRSSRPVEVVGLNSGIAAITAGFKHACALTAAGGVLCWGSNEWGQLGDGNTNTARNRPVAVNGLSSGVRAIAAGYYHTCAAMTSGGVMCWGYNRGGALGDGTTTNRPLPVAVSGLDVGIVALAAGGSYYGGHTCALTTNGGVMCWGANGWGQLGDGGAADRAVPAAVSGLESGVTAITANQDHTCALTASGSVMCWGRNFYGQLGDGSLRAKSTPVMVSGLDSGAVIAAGHDHTCALNTLGGVKCWGWNAYGQLGDGTKTDRHTPVAVSELSSGMSSVDAGSYHTCAVTTEGGVKCWGKNSSVQLGDGTGVDRLTPVDVVQAVSPTNPTPSPTPVPVARPTLSLNVADGAPGSAFLVTGTNFPTGATLQLSVNGVMVGSAIVDGSGRFTALLQTNAAAAAGYYVVVAGVASASGAFAPANTGASSWGSYQLASAAPLRAPPSEAPQAIAVPISIPAYERLPIIYLPLVQR